MVKILFILALLGTMAGAAKYEASTIVKNVHNYPHYNYNLNTVGNDFDVKQEYFIGAASLAATILGFGVLSVLILSILLVCRSYFSCCCECLKCKPDPHGHNIVYDSDHKRVYRIPNWLKITLGLSLFFGIGIIHLCWVANTNFHNTFDEIIESINALKAVITGIIDAQQLLDNQFTAIMGLMNNARTGSGTCYDESSDYQMSITATAVSVIGEFLFDAPDHLRGAAVFIESYRDWVDYVTWAGYGFVELVFGVYLLMIFLKCRHWLPKSFVSWFTLLFMLILTVLCCLELFLITVTADICIDPSLAISTSGLVKKGGDASDFIENYTARDSDGNTCTNDANSAIQLSIDAAEDGFELGIDDIQSAISVCASSGSNTADYSNVVGMEPATLALYQGLQDSIDCPAIASAYINLVEKGVCTEFIAGFYYFWLAKHLSCLFLFITLSLCAHLWVLFDDVDSDISKLSQDNRESEDMEYGNLQGTIELSEQARLPADQSEEGLEVATRIPTPVVLGSPTLSPTPSTKSQAVPSSASAVVFNSTPSEQSNRSDGTGNKKLAKGWFESLM